MLLRAWGPSTQNICSLPDTRKIRSENGEKIWKRNKFFLFVEEPNKIEASFQQALNRRDTKGQMCILGQFIPKYGGYDWKCSIIYMRKKWT